jgi:hypothetical protein
MMKTQGPLHLCVRLAGALALFLAAVTHAQSIQPVIQEYTDRAEGKFLVTNDTLLPMAVVLEPKSFDIGPDGRGTFRPLDPVIHLDLSTSSFRLEPKQSFWVFYKANAEAVPAWFTIYANFTPIKPGPGLKVRLMLPHTVYLYQKRPVERDDIKVLGASFDKAKGAILLDVQNISHSLVRVQGVTADRGKSGEESAGFPLLPGAVRHVEVAWSKLEHPEAVSLHFPRFDLKRTLQDVLQPLASDR